MSNKPGVIILGKIPPPYFGPAIATAIILRSDLSKRYKLIHVDTRLNSTMSSMGKIQISKLSATLSIFKKFNKHLSDTDTKLVLVPIAQQTVALFKDSIFVILAKMRNKKVLLQLRGSDLQNWYNNSNALTRFYFKKIFSSADGAIVLGHKLKYLFEPFLPPNKIYVVPNGGNYSFENKRGPTNKIIILYFGNIMYNKGLDILLEALKTIDKKTLANIQCSVVGEFFRPDYEKKCRELVIENALPVEFKKPASGIAKENEFSNADIFVFTPRAPEGHPWVLIEAMAAGLPIISSDQGAITESIVDNSNGYIVTTDSPEEMKQRLLKLINDETLRKGMGAKSKELYNQNFTEQKMVENLDTVFSKVISDL